ncbi:MAG: hypothetical protein WC354_07285 [Candidatus Omnitrophota bacterium]
MKRASVKYRMDLVALALFCCIWFFAYCQSAEAGEIQTSKGKVITGIDTDEALKKYGMPDSIRDDFWYYSPPREFFIYFPGKTEQVYLYPQACKSPPGEAIAFRVFAGTPESGITDVSADSKILVSDPKACKVTGRNVVIPRYTGEYQVFAGYNGRLSGPAYLSCKEVERQEGKKVIINVLPYKARVPMGRVTEFTALGVFPLEGYTVKDISAKAKWFIRQDTNVMPCRNNTLSFSSAGKFDVFCEYADEQSPVQPVYARKSRDNPPHILRNILLLPESVKLKVKQTVFLKAFGTYYDNKVVDITADVRWLISDKKIGNILQNGVFYARTPGSTEITASFAGRLKSLPVRISVRESVDPERNRTKSDKPPEKDPDEDKNKDNDNETPLNRPGQEDADDPVRQTQNDGNRMNGKALKKQVKLVRIKISPGDLKVPSGKEAGLKAVAIYSDGREKDITSVGDWAARDENIAVVAQGRLSGLSAGKTNVSVKMRGVESEPVPVTVTGPDLLSIIVAPQKAKLSRLDRMRLKAQGYYSDFSFKDITLQAAWPVTGRRILKVEKSVIIPLGFGKTVINAEYAGVRSLPVSVEIVFTWAWFWRVCRMILAQLVLVLFLLFLIFYLMIKHKAKKILGLKDNPRGFISAAYNNLKRVMGIFGFQDRPGQAPLTFARLAEEKFRIKGRVFISLTEKLEEALYSRNSLSFEDVNSANLYYELALKDISANYGKVSLALKYLRALVKMTPFALKTTKY